jgi:signal peptidase II
MKKSYLIFSLVALFVIVLDQLTKQLVVANLGLHDSIPVISGFLNLVHVRNPGAAFGFLAKMPGYFRSVFFISVTIGAIAMILFYLKQNKVTEKPLLLSLSLIFAGAIGNLIDRLRFGEVVDFVDVYVSTHHWPAFNVADSAISVGAVFLLISLIRHKKTE